MDRPLNGKGKEMAEKTPNRFISEKSPYLLQHAYNPVDWYPWGEEAFEKARKEDKAIFLSIGYSTCHWCHVMEKESFSGFHPNMVVLLRPMGKGGGSLIDSIASFLSNYGPVKDKITAYLCEGFACVPPPLSLMTSIGCWLERGTKEARINTSREII